MADGFERLRQEAAAIVSAPILAGAILAVALAVMWTALHWSYRAALENKDNHIAFLERRLSEYRDRLNGATPDEARKRIDALDAEVKTLRVRLQPRQLTQAQRQAIIDRYACPPAPRPRISASPTKPIAATAAHSPGNSRVRSASAATGA